jgi:hypothetical protein
MNAYLAKLVFRIVCGNGNHTPQFDEQLRLVYAEDEREAIQTAKEIGRKEEQSFLNQKQNLVSWQFINIADLIMLENFAEGAEVFSVIKEPANAEVYIDYVHKKANSLSLSACNFANT